MATTEATEASEAGRHARPARSWPSRLGWMVVLWAGGVCALALVAGVLKALMRWAGLAV